MTLLSHFVDPPHTSSPALRAYRHADRASTPADFGARNAPLAAIRRWLGAALAILLAAGALAGIIALKTAIFLSHLNY
jgi:hypothetical protein